MTGDQIEIITEGGKLGNEWHSLSSTLELQLGETGILFCIPHNIPSSGRITNSRSSYMVYSSLQGFIKYDIQSGKATDPFNNYATISEATNKVKGLTGTERVIRTNPDLLNTPPTRITGRENAVPTITGLSPSTIPAGIDQVLTITGTNFGVTQGTGFVEFRNGNNGGAGFMTPLATEYVSWTDTEIQIMVPTVSSPSVGPAGTGNIRVTNSDPNSATSGATVTIPWAYSNLNSGGTSVMGDHVNDNGSGGYTFQFETSFAANAPASAAFQRAMDTWTCATGMNWIVGAATAVNTAASDGTNVVRFDVGAELPVGVLGRCTSYYIGCGLAFYVVELDVVYDDAPPGPWAFGPAAPAFSEFDFETVTVHELGHGQQLNHIISSGAVMHYAIANGQMTRTLSAGDIAGGNFVTARSFVANACGPGPMTRKNNVTLSSSLTPSAICSKQLFSYTPTSATGGVTFSWSRATVVGISNAAGSGTGDPNEILINTTATPRVVNYVYTLTTATCTGIQTVSVTVNPINNTLAGTAGGAAVCANYSVLPNASGGTEYSDASCNLIAKVLPSGASPVTGTINACVKYETGVPTHLSKAYGPRHYDLIPSTSPATATATITLYYTQAEFTAFNAANGSDPDLPTGSGDATGIGNLRITQYHGTSGTNLPGSYSGAAISINPSDANIIFNATASRWEVTFDIVGFSGFFLHTGSLTLPLHLLDFSGSIAGNDNLLRWTTAQEENTALFDIQRSSDGTSFTSIGRVNAAGNNLGQLDYTFTDADGYILPVAYYQLKMIDIDGRFTYSPIIRLQRNADIFELTASPNPFRGELQVRISSSERRNAVVSLTDISGKVLLNHKLTLENGMRTFKIPGTQKLAAGTYMLTIAAGDDMKVIKVIKE